MKRSERIFSKCAILHGRDAKSYRLARANGLFMPLVPLDCWYAR